MFSKKSWQFSWYFPVTGAVKVFEAKLLPTSNRSEPQTTVTFEFSAKLVWADDG